MMEKKQKKLMERCFFSGGGEVRSAPWSRWQVRFWRVANFHLKEERSFCLFIFSYMTVSSIVPTFVQEHSFTIIIRHSVSVTVLHT